MDERRAIELCVKHRDPVGFESLVRKYRQEAYCHALALLGSEQDALDACQDAFARAFAAIPRLRSLPRFYPWFYCILRNRCLNVLARQRTSERHRHTGEVNPATAIETANPSAVLEQQEEHEQVRQALQSLKPEHREILAMKYIRGLSYDQIADLLGIPRGTIMSRLYYARMALREAFLELDRVPPDHNR